MIYIYDYAFITLHGLHVFVDIVASLLAIETNPLLGPEQ